MVCLLCAVLVVPQLERSTQVDSTMAEAEVRHGTGDAKSLEVAVGQPAAIWSPHETICAPVTDLAFVADGSTLYAGAWARRHMLCAPLMFETGHVGLTLVCVCTYTGMGPCVATVDVAAGETSSLQCLFPRRVVHGMRFFWKGAGCGNAVHTDSCASGFPNSCWRCMCLSCHCFTPSPLPTSLQTTASWRCSGTKPCACIATTQSTLRRPSRRSLT